MSATLRRSGPVWSQPEATRWHAAGAAGQLVDSVGAFSVDAGDRPWQVAWCAGAGVTGTTAAELEQECEVFESFLAALETRVALGNRDGALFLASSAGGVYAGSAHPPFDESTPPLPISDYGRAKLELEQAARRWSERSGIPVVIGRISNLYGPRQNVGKPQGLISQICRAHLLRQPLSIYVPLDTVRDYLYAPDCGLLVAAALNRLREQASRPGPRVFTKVLAAHQGVTIGFLIAELRRIFKRAPRIVYGASANSRFQVRDLRVRSDVWPDLDRFTLTPLPAGMKQTIDALTLALQAGGLN